MLRVDAALVAESDGMRVRVDGSGDVLTCNVEGSGVRLLDTLRRSRRLLPALRAITPLLVRTGLRLNVVAGTLHLARVGSGVKQNTLARLLRLPNVHIGR